MSNIVKLKEGITATNTAGDVVTFELEYDKFWNEYFLKPTSFVDKDGNKKTFSANINVFQKDQWNDSGLAAFNIDEDGKNLLHEQLVKAVAGVTKQYQAPVPKWAQSKNNTTGDADTATTDNSPPSPAQSDQSTGIAGLINTSLSGLNDFIDLLGNIADGVGNLKKLANDSIYKKGNVFGSNTTLVYPLTLGLTGMHKDMDTVMIRQFNYKAPNKEDFITGNSNVFENGLSGKDPEYRKEQNLGTVILPMPQSFEESRKVQYGEDTMNTLAAGMTQAVLTDMGAFAGGAALGSLLGLGMNLLPGSSGGNSSFGLGGIGGLGGYAASGGLD